MASLRLEHGLFSLGMPISHESILKVRSRMSWMSDPAEEQISHSEEDHGLGNKHQGGKAFPHLAGFRVKRQNKMQLVTRRWPLSSLVTETSRNGDVEALLVIAD